MFLFGFLVGAALNGLVVGAVVMLAGKVVLKVSPDFSDAFKVCFIASIVRSFVEFGFMFMLPEDDIWISLGVSLAASYVIYVVLFQMIIGYTMNQALAVAAVALVMMVLVLFGLALLFV